MQSITIQCRCMRGQFGAETPCVGEVTITVHRRYGFAPTATVPDWCDAGQHSFSPTEEDELASRAIAIATEQPYEGDETELDPSDFFPPEAA